MNRNQRNEGRGDFRGRCRGRRQFPPNPRSQNEEPRPEDEGNQRPREFEPQVSTSTRDARPAPRQERPEVRRVPKDKPDLAPKHVSTDFSAEPNDPLLSEFAITDGMSGFLEEFQPREFQVDFSGFLNLLDLSYSAQVTDWNLPDALRPILPIAGAPTVQLLGWRASEVLTDTQRGILRSAGITADDLGVSNIGNVPVKELLLHSVAGYIRSSKVQCYKIPLCTHSLIVFFLIVTSRELISIIVYLDQRQAITH